MINAVVRTRHHAKINNNILYSKKHEARKVQPVLYFYLGVSGVIVGHPFDTVKVRFHCVLLRAEKLIFTKKCCWFHAKNPRNVK